MKSIVLESAKGVKGGKVQLAFSQLLELNDRPTNVLGLLNASDERFTQNKPRYAWLSAEVADVKAQFGIDLSSLKEGEQLEIGAVDPRMIAYPDSPLNIQVTETTEGSEWQVANFEKSAKRAGKEGDFILTKDGMYIYVQTSIVVGNPKHTIITDTVRKTVSPLDSVLS